MAPPPVELPRLRMRHALLEAAPELAGLLGGEGGVGTVGGLKNAAAAAGSSASAAAALRSSSSSSSPQRKQSLLHPRSSFDAEKTEEEQVVR